jgi:hypothetical protein
MGYRSKIGRICVTMAAMLLSISQIARGDETTATPPSPKIRQYLIEARLYQECASAAKQDTKITPTISASSEDVRKSLANEKTKDKSNSLSLLASPRILVQENLQADVHIGDTLGVVSTTSTGTAIVETTNAIPVGTLLTVRAIRVDEGKIRVNFTVERTTGHKEEDADVVATDGVRIYGHLEVEPGKTVKACDFTSNDSKRTWLELTVSDWLPESTTAATTHKQN